MISASRGLSAGLDATTCGSSVQVASTRDQRHRSVPILYRPIRYRELGKLPRTAPDGVILQLGGHGH